MVNSICGYDEGRVHDRDGGKAIYGTHVHEAVERARDDQGAVPVEMHGGHVVEMGVQRFGAFPWVELAIPEAGKGSSGLDVPLAAFHILTSPSHPPDTSCVPSLL
jgi:hypothetical protein